ncbi:uracil-DNA glycosylase [Saprospiraceae bacterium]|nr:uracil-DNA glycosylase [Saprospiraceae bacterium]
MEIPSLANSWNSIFNDEFQKPYFKEIEKALAKAKQDGKTIYPPESHIFNAFNLTSFDNLKVVIIGQDPYHKSGQAMGLSFSVPKDMKVPPSLKNIYKEINEDVGCPIPDHGDLSGWASQGILLLNAILTVEEKSPGSHKKLGWQIFTDAIISFISDTKEGVIFMLWGNYAIGKASLIDTDKHHILKAAHPSPLARSAFFGCKHFSRCNDILHKQGKSLINWTL